MLRRDKPCVPQSEPHILFCFKFGCSAFDIRSSHFTTRALAGSSCNRLPPPLSLPFMVRFCNQPGPARASCSSSRQVRVCLSSKKSTIWSAHLLSFGPMLSRFPTPNATNTISLTVGTQAPGVPCGNFVKNSEIRRNLRVPVGQEMKIAVAFFPA